MVGNVSRFRHRMQGGGVRLGSEPTDRVNAIGNLGDRPPFGRDVSEAGCIND